MFCEIRGASQEKTEKVFSSLMVLCCSIEASAMDTDMTRETE